MMHLLRHPLTVIAGSATVLIGGFFVVSSALLGLPGPPVQQMALVFSLSGALTSLLIYALYRLRILEWFGSLRWTLLLMSLFTTGVVLVNVWVLSRLMFVDAHYVTLTGIVLVFAGLTATVFSYFISRAMTDRLVKLASAADRLAAAELSTRLDVSGNDEIAHLAQAFNSMAASLQEVDHHKQMLERTRRDLVAWVSHDLRTPLTSMRVMLEALNDGIIDDEATRQRYIQTTLNEIAHLNRLIDDLFEMARLDVGHLQMERQPASVRDLISDTISSMTAKATQRHLTLGGDVAPGVDLIYVAPDKIQRVLYNLVSNAIDYTPAGERILIRAHPADQPGFIQIDVFNSGVYIAEDVLPRLFESFYRGEQSRAQSEDGTRGTGLGLAIARGFIEAHGGHIRASSQPGSGTTFSITLPRNPPPQAA